MAETLLAKRSMAIASTTLEHHESPSSTIVELVADVEDVSAVEVSPPLYEAVDPDALDELFGTETERRSSPELVSFRYSGYDVTVSNEEETTVSLAEARRTTSPTGPT